MGYFPNGMSGEYYQEQYCSRCIHEDAAAEKWCPIWNMHLIHNYKECNNEKSLLHELIPRDGIHNGQCVMFVERVQQREDLPPRSTAAEIHSMEHLRAHQARQK